jgi:hypothetical protein
MISTGDSILYHYDAALQVHSRDKERLAALDGADAVVLNAFDSEAKGALYFVQFVDLFYKAWIYGKEAEFVAQPTQVGEQGTLF